MKDILVKITDKDDKKAYEYVQKMVFESEGTNMYYEYFDDFVSLLDNPKSYIRTRAFILICSQAKWDVDNKIKKSLSLMANLFYDEKATVVRQSLKAIKEVITYKPELKKKIELIINKIDSSKYKDSMSKLINKDIDDVKNTMEAN